MLTVETMQRALSRATTAYRASVLSAALAAGPGTHAWLLAEAHLAQAPITANETFRAVAEAIADRLQPPGRGAATAATFDQIAEIGGDLPLTVADLAAGFDALGHARPGDVPAIAARRRTCSEISALISAGTAGDPRQLATVFRRLASHFADSADPRQATIAATAAREAEELEQAEHEPQDWIRLAVEAAEALAGEEFTDALITAGFDVPDELITEVAKRVGRKLARALGGDR